MVTRTILWTRIPRNSIVWRLNIRCRRHPLPSNSVVCFSGPSVDGPANSNANEELPNPTKTSNLKFDGVRIAISRLPSHLVLPLAYVAARLAWKPNLLPELGDAASLIVAYSSNTVLDLSKKFELQTASDLQDLINCLVLSECVYKCVGRPEEEAFQAMSELKSSFPPGLVTIRNAQFSNEHTLHRFMLAESGEAFYVALMGTKYTKDYVANVEAFDEMVPALDSQGQGPSVCAHRGYLKRANSVPVVELHKEAQRRGKRLVFCGHSLGGAVATLCAIRLLCKCPPFQPCPVSCIGFATPAIGNQALAELVSGHTNWEECIKNYLVPEDPIPHLLTSPSHQGLLSRRLPPPNPPTKFLKSRTGRYIPIGQQIFVTSREELAEEQRLLATESNQCQSVHHQQETIFPMHRMFTYRTRILQICKSLIIRPQHRAFASILQDFQTDIRPTRNLAPPMLPSRTIVIQTRMPSSPSSQNLRNKMIRPLFSVAGSALATRHWISKLPNLGQRRPSRNLSRVFIQVEGQGLGMVGSAWLAISKGGFNKKDSGTNKRSEVVAIAKVVKVETVSDVRFMQDSRKNNKGNNKKDRDEREYLVGGTFDWALKKLVSPSRGDGVFATERLILCADLDLHRNVFDGPVFLYLQSPFDVLSLPLDLSYY